MPIARTHAVREGEEAMMLFESAGLPHVPIAHAATPGVWLHVVTLTDACYGPRRAGHRGPRPEMRSVPQGVHVQDGDVDVPGYILAHVPGNGSSLACFACGTYTMCSARLLRLAREWRVRKSDA